MIKGERTMRVATASEHFRPIRLSLIAILVLVVMLFTSPSQPTSASQASATPNCGSSFDPYAYTETAVSACGYQTFPLVATHSLPGGGTSYDYLVHGARVEFLMPPKGFDPSKATNTQLEEYGFPSRPSSPAALARWSAEMGSWRAATRPPPFLAETHTSSNATYSSNWSGYAVTGGPGTYTHAEAWYSEPSYYSSVCTTNAESTWAGIGGFPSTSALGQNGTAHGVPGLGDHQAWWEIVPGYNMMAVNFYGHPGYLFDASTRWLGNGYRFYYYDNWSASSIAFDVSSSTYSGNSAEVVAERPTINGTLSNLSNFGTITFIASQANGFYFNSFSTNTRYGLHMVDSSYRDMADPGPIGSGGSFTDTQHSCY